MAVYKYKALKNTGKTIESIIFADSEPEAMEKIAEMGYALETLELIDAPDRRIYERLEKSVEFSFSLFRPGQSGAGPQWNGITKNISAGGLFFSTAANLRPGLVLEISLHLADNFGFECLARVIRSEKSRDTQNYDTAVCFLDLPNAQRQRLSDYISQGE